MEWSGLEFLSLSISEILSLIDRERQQGISETLLKKKKKALKPSLVSFKEITSQTEALCEKPEDETKEMITQDLDSKNAPEQQPEVFSLSLLVQTFGFWEEQTPL